MKIIVNLGTAINGHPKGIPFRADELQDICNRAADVLKVVVYGGDCIVSPDGEMRIDFKLKLVFAPCREEASREIANH